MTHFEDLGAGVKRSKAETIAESTVYVYPQLETFDETIQFTWPLQYKCSEVSYYTACHDWVPETKGRAHMLKNSLLKSKKDRKKV